MSLSTYLTFDGNCREVFEFYRSVFGGEFTSFQTFADAPPDMPVPESEKDRVMHLSLPIGSSVLMGSDSASGSDRRWWSATTSPSPSTSRAGSAATSCSPRCPPGGSVLMPLQETFWGRLLRVVDRQIRYHWMVNYTLPTE